MALCPLERAFGVESVFVSTMRVLSGAGYPGVASLDIIDNVIPHIGGEEEKVETGSLKILGQLEGVRIRMASFKISAQRHRVHVQDGHLLAISVKLRSGATEEDVARKLPAFPGRPQELAFPSAPTRPIEVRSETDPPQPRVRSQHLLYQKTFSYCKTRSSPD